MGGKYSAKGGPILKHRTLSVIKRRCLYPNSSIRQFRLKGQFYKFGSFLVDRVK